MAESTKLAGAGFSSVPTFESGALPVADRVIVRARNSGVVQSEQPVDLRQAALEGDRGSVQRNRSSASEGVFTSIDDSGLRARTQQDLNARQKQIEEAVKQAAREEADSISIKNGALDAQRVQKRLKTIAQAHSISEAETSLIVDLFQRSFESRRQERFDNELNWFERQYYRAKSWISSISALVSALGKEIAELAKGVAEIGKAVGNGVKAVVSKEGREKIVAGLRAAKDKVLSKEFWRGLGSGCMSVVKGIFNPEMWKKFGRAIGAGLAGLAKFGWALVTDPAKALEMGLGALSAIKSFAAGVGRMIMPALKAAGTAIAAFAVAVVTDPAKALQMGLSVLKVTGKFLLEMTGIPAVCRMLKCAARGDWRGFWLNARDALLNVTMLAATVLTAGAAGGAMVGVALGRAGLRAAAKHVLKVAAEKFLGKAAEQLGAMAVRQFEKNVDREILQRTLKNAAVEIADKGIRDLGTKVMKEGASALTHEAVHDVIYKGAKETAERVSREIGVDKIAKSLTKDLLHNIDGKSAKKLAEELVEQGLASSKKEALQISKAVKAALSNTAADREIAEILTKGMTKHLSEYFETAMKEPFMERFEKGLLGKLDGELKEHSQALHKALKEQAEKLGKSVEGLAREYTDTAWKAAQKGIREGVEKVVREGVESAIKEFRRFKTTPTDGRPADAEQKPEETRRVEKKGKTEGEDAVKKAPEQKSEDLRKSAQQEIGKAEKVRMAVTKENLDGEQVQEIYEVVGTEKHLVGSTTIAKAKKAERKAA